MFIFRSLGIHLYCIYLFYLYYKYLFAILNLFHIQDSKQICNQILNTLIFSLVDFPQKSIGYYLLKISSPKFCGNFFTLRQNLIKGDYILDIIWRILFLNIIKDALSGSFTCSGTWAIETLTQPHLHLSEIDSFLDIQ